MSKDYKYDYNAVSGNTASNWKLHVANRIVLVDNTGKTPIRIDKVLAQLSYINGFTSPKVFAAIVHLSDVQGNYFDVSVGSGGVMTDAQFETALGVWKEQIWMTDIRMSGTSTDEQVGNLVEFAADTKRLLQPGQKLALTYGSYGSADSSATNDQYVVDAQVWYNPASQ